MVVCSIRFYDTNYRNHWLLVISLRNDPLSECEANINNSFFCFLSDMIYVMAPYMLLSLIPFVLVFEARKLFSHLPQLFDLDCYEMFYVWIKISIGAFLAFFMEISEFLVLSQTSSLTLSVSGIFKEICQLVLAVEINGEVLTVFNLIGLVLCLAGITGHVIHKYFLMSNDTLGSCTEKSDYKDRDKDHNASNFDSFKMTTNSREGQKNVRKNTVTTRNAENLKVPLLDSDMYSDDEENELENRSAEVLFDILKWRGGINYS